VAGPLIKDGYAHNISNGMLGVNIIGKLKLKSFNHTFAYANRLADTLRLEGDFLYETEIVDIRLIGDNEKYVLGDLKMHAVKEWFKEQNERMENGAGHSAQEGLLKIAIDIVDEANNSETPMTVEFETRDGVVVVSVKETTVTELKFSL
jgi:uncharacterized protein YkuJ